MTFKVNAKTKKKIKLFKDAKAKARKFRLIKAAKAKALAAEALAKQAAELLKPSLQVSL